MALPSLHLLFLVLLLVSALLIADYLWRARLVRRARRRRLEERIGQIARIDRLAHERQTLNTRSHHP